MPSNELGFGRDVKSVQYSDFSGGLRLGVEPHKIRDNEVWLSENAILDKSGIYGRPAVVGVTGYTSTAAVQGHKYFKTNDDTEYHIVVEGGKVYSIDSDTTGARTELFDTGSTTKRASFAVGGGKLFIATGGIFCKVEKVGSAAVAYRVGIAKPTTGAVAKAAGGSLPIGVYTVFWSHARTVSGINVLYSQPFSLGTIELTAGDQTIALTGLANSTDPQVGDKVVWLREPAGTIDYYYGHTGNNTSTTLNITSDANKSILVTARNYADDNGLPPNFDYVVFQGDKINGGLGLVVYQSIKSTNNYYDYERFPASNYIIYPCPIRGLVAFSGNLYINTEQGIINQPNGESAYQSFFVSRGEYWKHIDTVCEYGGILYGLTNFGIKIFDGEKFFQTDISDPIRKELRVLYSSINISSLYPCAAIFARDSELGFSNNTISRIIYCLSYNNSLYGMTCNNRRLELNLNAVQLLPNDQCIASWEYHTIGFDSAAVKNSGIPYFMQRGTTKSVLYYENNRATEDTNVYDKSCVLMAKYNIVVIVNLKMLYSGGEMVIRFLGGHLRYGSLDEFSIIAIDFDKDMSDTVSIGESGGDLSFWEEAEWDVSEWSRESVGVKLYKYKKNINTTNTYQRIRYSGNSSSWYVTDIVSNYKTSKNRFTYAL
jgi:hypothetical protein